MTTELNWQTLDSSHLEAYAYDAANQQVYIRFKGAGSVYRYPASAEEADGLGTADSPGRYFHLMFKHSGERVS